VATHKHIAGLILRQRRNLLNELEKEELEAWCNLCEENRLLFDRLNKQDAATESLLELYSTAINDGGKVRQLFPDRHKKRPTKVIKYAAIITSILLAGITLYSLLHKRSDKKIVSVDDNAKEKVNNGQVDARRVALKLADQSIVYLDSSINGHIALQYRSVVNKRGDMVRYEWSTGNAQQELGYNTITTPKARKFTLELPDGSKVWLNASSSITFPTAFVNRERIVQITGEAYFEVNPRPVSLDSERKKRPFIVYVKSPGSNNTGAAVEVTGTHFNVNGYGDDPVIKTTLLQGTVKVSNQYFPVFENAVTMKPEQMNTDNIIIRSATLAPGQQAQVNGNGQLEVVKYADIQEVMAWRKDLFIFNDLDIKLIMQQIARQYDYEIVFKGPVSGHYTLTVTRQTPLDQVLRTLELAGGVHFELNGRQISVSE
jgi:ferric-dicitrate binding protein FerR (iron transport regulator)